MPVSLNSTFNQVIACEILSSSGDNITLYTVYRPPNSCDPNFCENADELNKLIQNLNSILCGDFNYGEIDWDTLNCGSGQSEAFLESCHSIFLEQHVDFPTHIAGKTLDLILSNNRELIGDIKDCSHLAHQITI